jgi:hypothetical protein
LNDELPFEFWQAVADDDDEASRLHTLHQLANATSQNGADFGESP